MVRALPLAIVLVAACSQPAARVAPPPSPPPPIDAGVTAAEAPASEPSYREVEFPPPRVVKPASPASRACLQPDREGKLRDHEAEREAAAIDRAIRAHGYTPLAAVHLQTPHQPAGNHGAIVRGPNGERLMYVSDSHGCSPSSPIAGLSKSNEVVLFSPTFMPRHKRKLVVCAGSCYGRCGTAPRMFYGVEVPAGAKLGESRALDVPIDTHVEFEEAPGARCMPP